MGFEVHRTTSRESQLMASAKAVRDSEYYAEWSTPGKIFVPWSGHPEFEAVYRGVEEHTIVSRGRCYMLAALAGYASHLRGDAAECGVYTGGTALLLSRVLAHESRCLYLFDSFEGLPEVDPAKDEWFYAGEFKTDSVESVERVLKDFEDATEIRQGWIPETFGGLEDKRYVFVHVDVDLYRSALDCCEYFYPRLVPGAVMVFDEYGFLEAHGERDAVDEFFADKPESPISLVTGQAFVIRLPEGGEVQR
jgi:O-methyltransferase